ncbi:MAG: hypothetical protein IKL07_06925 [Clostridium sp.]|nr:hypothetical protein [Clostridium sp.]
MKRICTVLFALSLSVVNLQPVSVQASQAVNESSEQKINVLNISSQEELINHYDDLNAVDVVQVKQDTLETLEMNDVKEVLDNGTDMLVSDSNLEAVEELFEVSQSASEEGEQSTAVYITTENSKYQIHPVYADVIYEENESVSDEKIQDDKDALHQYLTKDFMEPQNASITASELYSMVHEKNYDELLIQMADDELVSLQTSTLIGNSFCENSRLVYFYKEGSANGTGTDYEYSSSSSKSGWSKMGSLNMELYALKIKTIGETTYDNVYSMVVAKGFNDKHVKQFDVDVTVPEVSTNVIIDATTYKGTSTATNGKIATSVNSSGSIPSSGYTTYAYNPGAQIVSNDFSSKYSKGWSFTPTSAVDNGSWRVRPAITLKKTNGTKTAVTANVIVDYFKVSGGVRNYTMKDTVKCSIKFVNHREA